MAITFKPKIILVFFLDILIIFAMIAFFCLVQTNTEKALAEEENYQNCLKLKDPKLVVELKELRVCLEQENRINKGKKRIRIIKRSYEGSLELTEKINMRSDNKSLKKFSEES